MIDIQATVRVLDLADRWPDCIGSFERRAHISRDHPPSPRPSSTPGARCVIAPLWSVKDYVAHDVARTFYREMHDHPDQPLAAIFKTIRRRAYERVGGEDTYAAYAFYGDPTARPWS